MMIRPLDDDQVQRVQECYRRLAPQADELARGFYTRLFALTPQLRALVSRGGNGGRAALTNGPRAGAMAPDFRSAPLNAARSSSPQEHERAQDFVASLGIIVQNLHRLDAIEHLLGEMGARCQRAGVQPQHYGMARDALLGAFRDSLGPEWTEQLADDWAAVLNVVASMLIRGAGQARRAA